jgi:hypothetical protein
MVISELLPDISANTDLQIRVSIREKHRVFGKRPPSARRDASDRPIYTRVRMRDVAVCAPTGEDQSRFGRR